MGSLGSDYDSTMFHVFLVSFPGQGHVNPLLRLGKILASNGLLVTFSAPEFVGQEMRRANNISGDQPTPVGRGFIRFEFFDDDWDVNSPGGKDFSSYLAHLEIVGKQVIPAMLKRHEQQGRPVSCLINNPFIPWVADVAESLGIPGAVLWVQSCACFSAYYHYFHGLARFPSSDEPESDVLLPGMPLLKHDEIPSFLLPGTKYPFLKRAILGQFEKLSKSFCVLIDTFEELEYENIQSISSLCSVKAVGPLFKIEKKSAKDSKVSGDFIKADDCIDWLDSKPPSSVVYISFGSIVYLKQEQIDEIAYGLMDSGVSFLWAMKPPSKETGFEPVGLPDGFLEKTRKKGLVVQWSPQEQVLAHPSVACFMTHCGWNSSLEALASGIPVITFPQWGDQITNAKFLVDEFKVGLRLSRGENENRLILRDEVERCLLDVCAGGDKAVESIKENAAMWKRKAEDAVAESGSSHRNFREFIDEIERKSNSW